MHHPILRLSVTITIALCMTACASNRRPERPEVSPERKQSLYSRMIDKWDINRDGIVTCDDVAAVRRALFSTLDTDDNEVLSPKEYRFAQFEDKSFLFYPYEKANTRNTNDIDFAEFSAVPHTEFAGIDRNKDCTVSVDEAAYALRDEFRERRGRDGRREGRRGEREQGGNRPPR